MKKYYILLISLLHLISSLSTQQYCCCDIIQTTLGFVEAGNTTVFTLHYPESFDICLSSERGDADLYVSDKNTQPSYDPDSYVLHSATCGDDIVHINEKLKRPIYVSVFGHPSAEISFYYMNIVLRESSEVDLLDLELLNLENEESIADPVQVETTLEDNSTEETNRSLEETNIVPELAPVEFLDFDSIKGFFNKTILDDSGIAVELIGWILEMFLDVLHEDGLVVSAKGLGLETVFLNLIKIYCDPGNLVLVLGTNADEETYFINELQEQKVTTLPKILSSEYSVTEREQIYAEGGVLFVSSRIIVVDLLKHRVPIKYITGFLVYRAHKVLESCQDGFALRLYRLENKTGFVKAFSSSAESFTRGFARVERVMKTLFVKNLYLWPRFQAVVNSSLEKFKPDVVELHLQLTPMMLELQTALLDLISYVVREIKRINPTLDTDEVSVENALSKSFHKLLQIQLDPVWHQLSATTKQLLADLKTLRHILLSLTQTDSVRFNNLLTSLRTTEYAHRSSGWVLMDSGETLFVTGSKRLYNSKNEVDPEPNPKWKALDEILKEIRSSSGEQKTVLILVNSIETCRQLKDYLVKGAKQLLNDLYKRFFGHKNTLGPTAVAQATVDEEEADTDCFTLSQQPNSETGDYNFVECSQDNIGTEPVVIIQTFKKEDDPLSLPKLLQMHKPHYIIMYDADMTAIRQIEVFQSRFTSFQITVYFPIYTGAVEEQAYLTTLRRERAAFEFLINEKSTMVVPSDQDGKSGDCPELTRDVGKSLLEDLNTRKGGLQQEPKKNPLIIVDMREFRSELPVLLHRRGIDIEPVTIEVGDYILSPDMCVERKSINDLIGSLNTGRLYQQAKSMTRHYAKPMLLIEFDQNKPFDLQGRYYLSRDLNSSDVTAKLQLLTLHFPKLKIVWSPSPYATAQLFHEIKEGRPEPSAEAAAAVGQGEGMYDDNKYNSAIVDFVSKLPGVSSQNINVILNKAESLEQLLTFSKDQLQEILKNSAHADQLYGALHKEFRTPVEKQASVTSKRTKSRGFRAINKKKK